MREEFDEVEAEFATPRVTELAPAADGIEDEDLIEREDMVVTVTMAGYIKRTPLAVFREQKRGGKGRAGMATKEEDAVTDAVRHLDPQSGAVLLQPRPGLPDEGLAASRRRPEHQGPADGQPAAAGRRRDHLDRACRCPRTRPSGAACTSCSRPPMAPSGATAWRRSPTSRPPARSRCASARCGRRRRSGDDSDEQADPTDRLIGVELLTEGDDVLLATRNGKAIRFKATDVREFQSRTSTGVRGVRLLPATRSSRCRSCIASAPRQEEREAYLKCSARGASARTSSARLPRTAIAELPENEQFILTVTENGYGKRSSAYEYRRTNRGGQGITNIDTSERNGRVVASASRRRQGEQLMLVTDQGKMIRTTVGDIRIEGRNTQGVTIFRVAENEHVVSVAKIEESDEEEIELEGGDEIAPVDDAVIGESELEQARRPGAGIDFVRSGFCCDEPPQPAPACSRSPEHSFRRNCPCPFPTMRWSWSPTAARCCSSAITATRIKSTFGPKPRCAGRSARTGTSRPMRRARRSRAPAMAARPMRRPISSSRKKTAGSRTRPKS